MDRARIGLWGGSYGGYLTALGLARNSDIYKAGVDYAGVHDWTTLRGTRAAAILRNPDTDVAYQCPPSPPSPPGSPRCC